MAGAIADKVSRNILLSIVISVVLVLVSGTFLIQAEVVEKKGNVFNNAGLEKAKEQLRKNPEDQQLQWTVRELDRVLRNEYIYGRNLSDAARYLLVFSALSLIISARLYVNYRYKPTVPESDNCKCQMEKCRVYSANSMLAFSCLLVLISGGYLISNFLPADADSGAVAGSGTSTVDADKAATELLKQNWHRFRGFGGSGRVNFTDIPLEFDLASGKNVAWTVDTELPGFNSPIIFGDKFFYAGANEVVRKVYCHNLADGKLIWQAQIDVAGRASDEAPNVMEDTGFAAPTLATDGQRVYSIFANGDAACHDFTGKQLWAMNLGLPESTYGYAASLEVWRDGVIIQFDHGYDDVQSISELISIDGKTGEVRWRNKRPVINSWTSPIIEFTAGKWQYITVSNPWVISYDPSTGSELWRFGGMHGDTAPSPIVAGNVVIAISPTESVTAVNSSLSGDVSATGALWKYEDGAPDTTSPVAGEDKLWLLNAGSLEAFNLADGSAAGSLAVDGSFYCSPTLVGDDKIILLSMEGNYTLISVAAEPQKIYETSLGEKVCSSPAFAQGVMLIRTEKKIVRISTK